MSKKRIEQLMSELFGFSTQSYFNWKRDAKTKRKIIDLLDIYFSKEMLEEFLETGKIHKYELIKDMDTEELEFIIKNKGSSNERLQELLKFFSISDSKELGRVLASGLRNNGLDTGIAEYLDKIPNMQQLIYTLRNILNDRSSELKKNSKYPTFEHVLKYFNENVGFDFNENDELTLSYILGRYRVYNTLYNFEKTTKTSFV